MPDPDPVQSKRESVLDALHALLAAAIDAPVLRDEVVPETMPADGLVIIRDGDPGAPEVTLSPLAYHYEHRAEVEVFVQDGIDRAAAFDALLVQLGTALASDRTLGGLCDWIEAEAPGSVDLPIEGAEAIKAAVVPVILIYSTTDTLL
jgi:hypothetical protein